MTEDPRISHAKAEAEKAKPDVKDEPKSGGWPMRLVIPADAKHPSKWEFQS